MRAATLFTISCDLPIRCFLPLPALVGSTGLVLSWECHMAILKWTGKKKKRELLDWLGSLILTPNRVRGRFCGTSICTPIYFDMFWWEITSNKTKTIVNCSDTSGKKFWVTQTSKPPWATEVLCLGKVNMNWLVEEGICEYQLRLCDLMWRWRTQYLILLYIYLPSIYKYFLFFSFYLIPLLSKEIYKCVSILYLSI